MTIIFTVASGFVCGAVLKKSSQGEMQVRLVFRNAESAKHLVRLNIEAAVIPMLTADTMWSIALANVNVVIHCAARDNVMSANFCDLLLEFRQVNVTGTLRLAQQTVEARMVRWE